MSYRETIISTENRKSVTKSINLLGVSVLSQQVCMIILSTALILVISFAVAAIGMQDRLNDIMEGFTNLDNYLGLGLQFVVFIPALTIPFVLYLIGRKRPIKEVISFKRPKLSQLLISYFATMALGYAGLLLTNYLVYLLRLIGYKPMDLPINAPSGVPMGIFFVVVIAVLPALLEEFAYRGVIMGEIRRYNRWAAVLISGLFFGLMHGNLIQIPYASFIGFGMAYFAIKFDSIWVGVFIHFINNSVAIAETYFVKFYPDYTKVIEMSAGAFQFMLMVIGVAIIVPFLAVKGIGLPKRDGEISFKLVMRGVFRSPIFYIVIVILLAMTLATLQKI